MSRLLISRENTQKIYNLLQNYDLDELENYIYFERKTLEYSIIYEKDEFYHKVLGMGAYLNTKGIHGEGVYTENIYDSDSTDIVKNMMILKKNNNIYL